MVGVPDLAEMRFRAVAAHGLADLVIAEAADHHRADEKRDRQRRARGENAAQRQVLEDIETRFDTAARISASHISMRVPPDTFAQSVEHRVHGGATGTLHQDQCRTVVPAAAGSAARSASRSANQRRRAEGPDSGAERLADAPQKVDAAGRASCTHLAVVWLARSAELEHLAQEQARRPRVAASSSIAARTDPGLAL
jgi:hypothetical protein